MSIIYEDKDNKTQTDDREGLLKQLRELLLTDVYLKCPNDDAFLLMFLRSMQYDCEGTFRVIQKYFQLRTDYPDMYKIRCPSEHKYGFENNILDILPQRDEHGRRICIWRAGKWIPEHSSVLEFYRSAQMILELIAMDEQTQDCGVVGIADFKDLGFHQVKHCRPWLMKAAAHMLQVTLRGVVMKSLQSTRKNDRF